MDLMSKYEIGKVANSGERELPTVYA